MKLRQLFEALGEEVAIIFGRFNPPHKGHRAAWELASKSPIWYVGTNQSTVGPKDPLPFDVKVEAMKAIWPEVEGHIVAETSWLTLASKVYKEKPNATLLCLTDEDWVTKTIQQYNGVEGPHGYYNFKKIEQKPTPRLSSATALRDAVTKGDREAFAQAAGVPADTPVAGKPFFDLVAEYLLPYQNTPKKVAKKKKEPEVAEGHDNYEFHTSVEKGKFLPSKFGNKRFVYLHDLEKKSPSTGGPQLVTIDDTDTAKQIASQYGGKVVKTKLDTFRIVKPAEQGVAEAMSPQQQHDFDRMRAGAMSRQEYDAKWRKKRKSDDEVIYGKKKSVAEGLDAEAYKQKLLSSLPQMMRFYEKNVKGWKPSEEQMLAAVETGYIVMKHTGDVKQAGKAVMDELNTLHRMSQGQQGVAEEAAGVGIITKQNSTKDVNKSTPRKNLKAFRLVK